MPPVKKKKKKQELTFEEKLQKGVKNPSLGTGVMKRVPEESFAEVSAKGGFDPGVGARKGVTFEEFEKERDIRRRESEEERFRAETGQLPPPEAAPGEVPAEQVQVPQQQALVGEEQVEDVGQGYSRVTKPTGEVFLRFPDGSEKPIFSPSVGFQTKENLERQEQVEKAIGRGGQIAAGIMVGAELLSGLQIATLATTTKAVTGKGAIAGAAKLFSTFKGLGVALLAGVGAVTGTIGALSFAGVDLDPDRVGAYQQSANTLGDQATDIVSAVNDQRLTPQAAEASLNFLEDGIAFYEQKLLLSTRENRKALRSGELFDVLTDIQERKQIIVDARGEVERARLRGEFPTVSSEMINDWISKMTTQEAREVEKEYWKRVEALSAGKVPSE